MAAGPGEDAATGRQTGALQGQVRTQLSAGIRGPVSKVWPRWISVGVLAEGGLRCECCMKLCPGERAEACWGAGRLPGLGLGTQTGEDSEGTHVLRGISNVGAWWMLP